MQLSYFYTLFDLLESSTHPNSYIIQMILTIDLDIDLHLLPNYFISQKLPELTVLELFLLHHCVKDSSFFSTQVLSSDKFLHQLNPVMVHAGSRTLHIASVIAPFLHYII